MKNVAIMRTQAVNKKLIFPPVLIYIAKVFLGAQFKSFISSAVRIVSAGAAEFREERRVYLNNARPSFFISSKLTSALSEFKPRDTYIHLNSR